MPDQTLTGEVRLTDQMTPVVQNIADAVQGVVSMLTQMQGATSRAFDSARMGAEISKIQRNLDEAKASVRGLEEENERLPHTLNEAGREADSLFSKLKRVAGAYIGLRSVGLFIQQADEASSLNARIDAINDGMQTTAELNQMLYESAQRSRGSFQDTANFVASLSQSAPEIFASNQETIQFAENLNKMFAASGTNAQEQASAMLQLKQALGSGVLRGEEFNAVMEASPGVIRQIADSMGVNIGQMRNLAAEGKITAEEVKKAILSANDGLVEQFNEMPTTFGQAMQMIKNDAYMAFQPVFALWSSFLQSPVFQSVYSGMRKAIYIVADALLVLGKIAEAVARVIAENWHWIQYVLIFVGAVAVANLSNSFTVLGGKIVQAFVAGKEAFLDFFSVVVTHPVVFGLIAAVLVLTFVCQQFGITIRDVVSFVVGVIAAGVAIVANIIIGIWNLIKGVVQFIANLVIDLINGILNGVYLLSRAFVSFANGVEQGWANLMNGLISKFESFLNFFVSGFNQVIGFINSIAIDIPSWVPGIGGRHIGFNIDKMENVKLNRVVATQYEGMQKPEEIQHLNLAKTEMFDVGQAFNVGSQIGGMLYDKGASAVGQIAGKLKETMDGLKGVTEASVAQQDAQSLTGEALPALDDIGQNTKGTKKNTDKMAQEKEMKRVNDQLDRLQKLAERRAVINVTWDKLNVAVSNTFGDVHETADLDGWLSGLNDTLNESIQSGVGGVQLDAIG